MTAGQREQEAASSAFLADLARLYPDLDTAFLRELGREFEPVRVAGGSTLVRRGDPSDALYILISGRLVATREDDAGRAVRLGEVGRGEMIGEMSLLSGGVRTATVTALRDSRLVRLSNQAFLEFMQRHPSVTRQFIRILTQRLMNQAPRRQEKLSTLALVPTGGTRDCTGFARELEAALRGMVSVHAIDRAAVEARLPRAFDDAAGEHAVVAWLDDEEQRNDVLVYVCGAEADAWSRLALRQADRVLLVAPADAADAAPGALERQLEAGAGGDLRGCELVLLHASDRAQPEGTARWLAPRTLRRHHHLRAGDAAGMARLCRHLLGRSVGLALGGGGAKAFAEVGVLRALEEAGIPVDVIGGTSMGAVVGALAALGQDSRAIHATLREMLRMKPFSGITVPTVSLLSGKRLARAMQALFGERAIEDLWRRYFCIACNLTHGTVKAAADGPLARWVGASNAVPGVMPPLAEGGELYVDGGLLNNVPADVMSELNAGPVIAVNVSGAGTLHADAGERLPRLPKVLVRAMLLGSANHAANMRHYASLYLTPDLKGADVSDWDELDTLVEAGYAHAREALKTWSPWTATN